MKKASVVTVLTLTLLLSACGQKASVTCESFGTLSSGEESRIYHITNACGASMDVTDYGCRIVKICMPDRDGCVDDVVVGPGDLESFEKGDRFFGCVIGRYGNRIDGSAFSLDGIDYDLVANESYDGEPVQCHGGIKGFDRFLWEGTPIVGNDRAGVRFHRISPDGEQGYPGNLEATVVYWLTEDNVVVLEYEATTDKPTVVNLSNHTYFNFKGSKGGYVLDHLFHVQAGIYVKNNPHNCPDLLLPVEGSPYDFRTPHRVDYRTEMSSGAWVIDNWDGSLRKVADLYDPESGRGVITWTTEPLLLTYTAKKFSEDKYPYGKYGPLRSFDGMLLETIHFPDSPNQSRFPSTVLRSGETYYSRTEYHFYTE